MKIKSLLTVIGVFMLIWCMSVVAFANQAKSEAIDYLKQVAVNTNKAQNLTYDVSLAVNSPVAEGSLTMQGKYADPMTLSGDMKIIFNLWILNIKYDMDVDYYSELVGNEFSQYFKVSSIPPIKEQNKWYVSKSTPQDNFKQLFIDEKQKNIGMVDKDIKNIFMYDVDENASKIYVTYHRPLIDSDALKLAQAAQTKEQLTNNPLADKKLQAIFTKPRDLTYEVTIDRKTNLVKQVNSDLSKVIQDISSEYLDTMPADRLKTEDGFDVKSVIKNYMDRSKFTVSINLSNINQTTVDKVPQKVKDTAIDASKIDTKDINISNITDTPANSEAENISDTSGVGSSN